MCSFTSKVQDSIYCIILEKMFGTLPLNGEKSNNLAPHSVLLEHIKDSGIMFYMKPALSLTNNNNTLFDKFLHRLR